MSARSIDAMAIADLPSHLAEQITAMPIGKLGPVVDALRGRTPALDTIARAILDNPCGLTASVGARSVLRAVEAAVIREALARTNGNVSAAARLLAVDRKQLERKVRRLPPPIANALKERP